MTYYFDIDNTITITPLTGEERVGTTGYAQAQPIPDRIAKVNKLYDEGHTIVYWTGRGSVSKENFQELTRIQLTDWGCKYHELRFGKPDFGLLIDDKAMHSDTFFQPMRVGLVLNNLIRDYISKLTEIYIKYTTPKDAKVPNEPIKPINPYKLEDSFPLNNDEFGNIYELLYHGITLEVFGGSNQSCTTLLQRLSNFQTKIYDKLILLSRETSRSKFATLSFLSQNQFDFGELIFVDSYEDYWKYVDVLITDNPEIFKAKPKGKIGVIYTNEYNTEWHNQEYKIASPEDIFTLPFFNRKPVKPEEMIHITKDVPEGEEEDKLEIVEQTAVQNAKVIGAFADKDVDVDLTQERNTLTQNDIDTAIKSD